MSTKNTTNDSGLQYLHPSIVSSINSEEIGFTPANASTSFFYATATEKGMDNKVKKVTSADEFLARYGTPNIRKYGQAGYNIMNLLNSGAEVYVLRVLPNDAGYAHAFLNVQSKRGVKKVKNVLGELVNYDDVHLRVLSSYSTKNTNSVSSLKNELDTNRNELSIDGYKDNLLLCMYPIGRGKYYNNLAFRLTLNRSYDELYDFRVYTLEVIEYDEYNSANIIEGPFYVSLDPESLSTSNESMFIVDVLERYSNIVRCIFNENAYDSLGALINKNVSPSHIDFLTGQSRLYAGQLETFFCEETNKYEDVHLSLHKYDITGEVVTENGFIVLNYADPLDTNVQTSVSIDNSLRETSYESSVRIVEKMSESLATIIQGTFDKNVAAIINANDSYELDECEYKASLIKLIAQYNKAYTTIFNTINDKPEDGTPTAINPHGVYGEDKLIDPEAISLLEKQSTLLAREIEVNLGVIESALPFLKLIKGSNGLILNIPTLESNIADFRKELNRKDSVVFSANTAKDVIVDLTKQLVYSETVVKVEDVVEVVITVFTDYLNKVYGVVESLIGQIDPALNHYYDSENEKILPYDEALNKIKEQINILYSFVALLTNQHLTETYVLSLINGDEGSSDPNMIKGFKNILNELMKFTTAIISSASAMYGFSVEYEILIGVGKLIDLSFTNSVVAKSGYEAMEYYKENYTGLSATASSKNKILTDANNAISEEKTKLINLSVNVLYNIPYNVSAPMKFDRGTDGNIDFDTVPASEREININKLLVSAYKGLIDPDVINRKLMTFKYLLDANFSIDVKNAMISLVRDIRQDLFVWIDTEFCNSPEEAVSWRANKFPISSQFASIHTQNFIVYDEYNGRDIKVSFSYFLANKIPQCAKQYGLHYPMAGPRRGIIDGYKEGSISFMPNELYKEQLYTRQVNYVETDGVKTKIGSQLTSDIKNTPLSNTNNVLTILDMKRDIEYMSEMYQFEFNDPDTVASFQYELNQYLNRYISNRACEEIKATVYASDYDKQQKILRVSVSIKFNYVIERIVINLDVVK